MVWTFVVVFLCPRLPVTSIFGIEDSMKHTPSTGPLGELCHTFESHLRSIFTASSVLDRIAAYDSITESRGHNPGRRLRAEPTVVLFKGVFSNGDAAFELMKEFIVNRLIREEIDPDRGDKDDQQRLKDQELCIWHATLCAMSLWKGRNDGHGWSIEVGDLYLEEIDSLRNAIDQRVQTLSFRDRSRPLRLDDPDAELFEDDDLDIDPRSY